MKIRYMSDLHLEFSDNTMTHIEPADVLILAGDITIKNRVEWINDHVQDFNRIFYVMGNHEFYQQNLDNTPRKTLDNLDQDVTLLNNESVTYDGVRFHGSTLWTNMNNGDPLTYLEANSVMNDFRLIRADHGQSRFTAQRAHKEHNIAWVYLNDNIQEGDVVISHHAPSLQSIHPTFRGQPKMNGAYCSDLTDLMFRTKPKLWFHGHVHNTFDYTFDQTRILCNPRGYVGHDLNPNFDIGAFVEI